MCVGASGWWRVCILTCVHTGVCADYYVHKYMDRREGCVGVLVSIEYDFYSWHNAYVKITTRFISLQETLILERTVSLLQWEKATPGVNLVLLNYAEVVGYI